MTTYRNDRGEDVELTRGEGFIVEWQTRMLGGFFSNLALTLAYADEDNLALLELAFPDEARAMREWKTGNLNTQLKAKGFEL
ncbi:MAG: hypothetical protein WC941_10775 [Candidatus Bathyarchaeia archaeon]